MNNPSDFRVTHSLQLLSRLRETLAEFTKKEDSLQRDLRARRYTLDKHFRETLDKSDTWFATQIGDFEAAAEAEVQRLRAIHEGRRTWIQRAHAAALRTLPKRAQAAKQRWMGDLQMKQFRAERNQTLGVERAEVAFAQLGAQLAALANELVGNEKRARKFFAGYETFLKMLRQKSAPDFAPDATETELLAQIQARLQSAEEQLAEFRKLAWPRFFSNVPIAAMIPLILAGGGIATFLLGSNGLSYGVLGGATVALLGGVLALHRSGFTPAKPLAASIAEALTQARALQAPAALAIEARHAANLAQVQHDFDRVRGEIAAQWDRADNIEADFEAAAKRRLAVQVPRAFQKSAGQLMPRLRDAELESAPRLAELKAAAAAKNQSLTATLENETAKLDGEEKMRWESLLAEWQSAIRPIFATLAAMNLELDRQFPAWDNALVESWQPHREFTAAARFGSLELDLDAQPHPTDTRLALPGSAHVSIPLALTFPGEGSLLFETSESSTPALIGTLNNVILRLLTNTPPGKANFTILDPVGLGQNFAGLMHLADYEESLINRRIWTQRDQIEERLIELSEHIEKVIQMYLRDEYATITQYNAQAGSVAEKYHFLVVADFPANFSETAARRLQSIATSGPRCGIFTLIHWDQRQALPEGVVAEELRKSAVGIRRDNFGAFVLSQQPKDSGAALVFDLPPEAELANALLHRIGKSSIDSNRVEVPFSQIAPAPEAMWTADTTSELRVAMGRTGATKLQYLAIGKGTRQHALFAGKTGSGKSTLFHVIITNLALSCSPDQVEFYLIDFKKGVEFKCYATQRLPHARVIAIESDREFALSVLQRVDDELKRRGDIFRKLGVQDIAGYKKAGGSEPVPRTLLIIDEFQEFFVEDDTIAQSASLLFDRIVRQGRAFGIHVLLGSQSLGGAYSLARATIGQMVIRVALQCNEADAYLIMDDSNSAARLLSRPGEGIYNDAGGAVAANSPFQVVWLPDAERDVWLHKIHDLAAKYPGHDRTPIIFEGNAPADLSENDALRDALDSVPVNRPATARAWLGAPNSIKGPTEAVFSRQSGNHLLIVGQRDEPALHMMAVALLSLAAQYPLGEAKFVLLNGTVPDSPEAHFIETLLAIVPHEVTVSRGQEIAPALSEVAADLKSRVSGEQSGGVPVFVFVHGLHKFKKLRQEDDFSFSMGDAESAGPGAQFTEMITEGSSQGVHLIVTVDTFNNVNRFMNRKALSEFEMRVVFQMSANDSASLIDSPRASDLGLHRALFYNEHNGTLETFRPYAAPDPLWLTQAGQKLATRR